MRKVASVVSAGAVLLFHGVAVNTGCGGAIPDSASSDAGGSSVASFTCNGRPASFPLDDLKSTGKPDAFVTEVEASLTDSLTAGEIKYFNQVDWSKFTGATVFTDPVVRKAVIALRPVVSQYCQRLTLRECSFSIGVAYAQTTFDDVLAAVEAHAGQVIVDGIAIVVVGALAVACGATVCTVAGIVGSLAIIFYSPEGQAAQLPDVGAPVDPALYDADVASEDGTSSGATTTVGGLSGSSGGDGISSGSGGTDFSGSSSGGASSGLGQSCPTSCSSDSDCASCPAAATGANCCDVSSGSCFLTSQSTCPAPPVGDGGAE
jgi:hypothetical protein